MHTKQKQPAYRGFTLIELMIVLAIVGIILVYSTPSMKPTFERSSLRDTRARMVQALNFARTEAVSRQQSVSLCGSTNGTSCNVSANSDWPYSIVFQGNGIANAEDLNKRLLVIYLENSTVSLNTSLNTSTGSELITFNSLGSLVQAVSFKLSLKTDSNDAAPGCQLNIQLSGIIDNPNARCN